MKYRQYQIISKNNIDELITACQNYIEDGWVPLGGMTVEVYQGFAPIYYQTLVK